MCQAAVGLKKDLFQVEMANHSGEMMVVRRHVGDRIKLVYSPTASCEFVTVR